MLAADLALGETLGEYDSDDEDQMLDAPELNALIVGSVLDGTAFYYAVDELIPFNFKTKPPATGEAEKENNRHIISNISNVDTGTIVILHVLEPCIYSQFDGLLMVFFFWSGCSCRRFV